jgi:hypothetical protein
LHKAEKMLMLETDTPETANEMVRNIIVLTLTADLCC